MSRAIDVTVAAVIERDQRYLLVEEQANGRIVLNQPAGHLEHGESLLDAVVRETLEETGFAFSPSAVLGIYLWQGSSETSFLRVAFCGSARPPQQTPVLDDVIIATHWLTRAELLQRQAGLRSPMVVRCIDDYATGIRYPLDCLTDLELGPAPLAARSR